MKIILIVPDGVGVRNYLFSNFTNLLLEKKHEIIILHKISDSAINEIKTIKPKLTSFIEIPSFIENPKQRILRESLVYARLLNFRKKLKNYSILKFWNPNKSNFKKKILYTTCEILGFLISKSEKLIIKLDSVYFSSIKKNKITKQVKNIFKELNADFILNLHQRAPNTAPLISATNQLGIKTATVIFSWDNVPKARLISRYDYYFVWSKLMKDELSFLYPEIKNSQIKITGTPQFEFYFESNFIKDKNLFFNKYDLDFNKKIICFSGNDQSSLYEEKYLEDICEQVILIKEEIRPQILFRRCPVDKSDRFDSVLKKYSNLIKIINPDWKTEKGLKDSFSTIFPTYNDLNLLVNTVNYSDVVINLGSTMAHDFAVYNKPCLYLNYDPVKNSKFKVDDVYSFQHFRSLKNIDAVGYINKKDEIAEKIIMVLEDSFIFGKERKKWLEKIVNHPLKNNSNLLIEKIEECTSVS